MIGIKNFDLESSLQLIADLDAFSSENYTDGELSIDELEWVSAAAAKPNYRAFKNLLNNRKV